MILGLCGPFNPEDPQRRKIAERFVAPDKIFSFSELTEQISSRLYCFGFIHEMASKRVNYDEYRPEDKQPILNSLEHVLWGIPSLKSFYTDWLGNQIAVRKGIRPNMKCSGDTIESIITDITTPEQARWLKTFGWGINNKQFQQNKIILIPDYSKDDPLNNPEFDIADVFEPQEPEDGQVESDCFFEEVKRIRKVLIKQ